MERRTKTILFVAFGVLLLGISVLWATDGPRNPRRVAYMLNISLPPQSLRVFACESGPWTDVAITCSIEISPAEFPLLLKGYSFSEVPSNESSYALDLPKLGPEFTVASEYSVWPAAFKNGGSVRVFADAESRRAIVDLFIE
jgi:hypothetical protein